jgi:hypothetical protein
MFGFVGIDVYTDPQTTTLCTNLDWGTISEGTIAIQTLYIKNSGKTVATLHLTPTDWIPTATASLMTLSWGKEDIDSFDFNIIIQSTA